MCVFVLIRFQQHFQIDEFLITLSVLGWIEGQNVRTSNELKLMVP